MHYLLSYEYVPDYLARRGEYRDAHLEKAWKSVAQGQLLLGGAVGEPPDSALLVFQADTQDVVEAFVKSDPYVQNGLVTRWTIKPWKTVVGDAASSPVRPG